MAEAGPRLRSSSPQCHAPATATRHGGAGARAGGLEAPRTRRALQSRPGSARPGIGQGTDPRVGPRIRTPPSPELLFAAPEGDSFCNSDSIRVLGDSESPGRMRQWGAKRYAPMPPVLPTACLQAGGVLGGAAHFVCSLKYAPMYFVGKYAAENICLERKYAARPRTGSTAKHVLKFQTVSRIVKSSSPK